MIRDGYFLPEHLEAKQHTAVEPHLFGDKNVAYKMMRCRVHVDRQHILPNDVCECW